MSKIGNLPITIPAAVQVEISNDTAKIKGQNGELEIKIDRKLDIKKENDKLIIKAKNDEKKTKSLHGLYRQLVANAVSGVENPWKKRLEIIGTGFNVKLQGEDLVFKVGYSHPVVFKKKEGIKYQVEGNNKVVILGIDKQLVGQVAYLIKSIKKPDIYKGKGIRYENEQIKLKPGKKVKATTGAA